MSKARLWLTIILPFALGYFITTAFRSINAILAFPLMESLHVNSEEIGWITSTFVLAFALVQIPLGILLDKWGARVIQTVLFFIGSIGIIIFGVAPNIKLLATGRALLGVGMAGGLMAAIKIVSEWVEKEKIPLYNGIILAAGGIGALVASTPSKLFELQFGWRTLCILLGIVTFLIALLILLVSRDKPVPKGEHPTLKSQIQGLVEVYRNRFFWQITPLFTVSLGGFIALQGLWLGPWLHEVIGLTPLESANYLFVIAVAMAFGFISGGLFSYLAKVTSLSLSMIVAIGIALHIVLQVLIILNIFSHHYALWFVYSYFSQVTLVNYAIIAQYFGVKLSGRAITAANILIFLFAFGVQYLFGVVIHLWPKETVTHGYQVAFSGLVVLELLALLWFIVLIRKAPEKRVN